MHADLAAASSHVHLSGWHFSPDFALVRGSKPVVLRNLLAELSERVEVRVLAWGGAPLPLFRPTRATVRRGMDELCRGTRVRYALDTRERPMHCHHEKTIEIDDRVAYVGGIDLSLEGGDRFDSHHHIARAKLGWHDVAARLEGPAVADVAAHFRMRWDEVTGERLEPGPTPQASGGHTSRWSAPFPSASTRRCRAGSSGSWTRTSVRCARRGRSSTWRTSSSGRPRSRRSSARSCAGRLRTSSGSCCCSRRSRTPAPTTRAECCPS